VISRLPLLPEQDCDEILSQLKTLPWSEGLAPGALYREKVKGNKEIAFQMSTETEKADQLIHQITSKILASQFIRTHMFPKSLVNPRFNLYSEGGFYGKHADSAFLGDGGRQVRSDYSLSLFLSDPNDYVGGELELSYPGGEVMKLKEPKGTLLFYPSGVMHQVLPVTSGKRIAFVGWIESHIQSHERRDLLSEVSTLCDAMMADGDTALGEYHTRLLNVKHNLFRIWWNNQ
jgi:PKHD-type hydroxylase